MKKYQYLFCIWLSFLSINVFAQAPINDECDTPIQIEDPTNYCSGDEAFTNVGATPSTYGISSCFTNVSNDVWFEFTAVATDVVITINGASGVQPGGTLIGPEVTLYSGICGGTINELECGADNAVDFIEIAQSGVVIGSNMLVRVEGLGDFTGTFELCVRNFNPPVDPSSDCPDAAILCDKSSFTVDQLIGAGNDPSEFDNAPCFDNGGPNLNNEFNSVWFKWTCDEPGSLTFVLTPTRLEADLDFILFELPGGINDCANKEIIRCEAAGSNPNINTFPTPCQGPTGLSFEADDVNENAGCQQGQDNFLAAVDMVAGRSYALGVNNFGPGTDGFSIEFGGTGTFLGPKPKFTADPPSIPCLEEVVFTDASTFANGDIVNWTWNFGVDAIPQTATGDQPHTVIYNSFGERFVTLTVESDEGCIVTEVLPFFVEECCLPELDDLDAGLVNAIDPVCNGDSTGVITIEGIEGNPFNEDDSPYYLYSDDGGATYQGASSFVGLPAGLYDLLVVDRLGCEEFIEVPINQPPPIIVNAGEDITVNLGETADLNGFYNPSNLGDTIIWTPDTTLTCDNCLDPTVLPLGTTTYTLMVENEAGCMDSDSVMVVVTENRPIYIPNVFTPNFDGVNDFFNVFSAPAADILEELEIYDRWGNLVYRGTNIEINNPNEGWDGTFRDKPMDPAVFAYVANVRFIDGVTLLYSGDVTLLR